MTSSDELILYIHELYAIGRLLCSMYSVHNYPVDYSANQQCKYTGTLKVLSYLIKKEFTFVSLLFPLHKLGKRTVLGICQNPVKGMLSLSQVLIF